MDTAVIVHRPRLYKCTDSGKWTLKQEHIGPFGFVHTAHHGHRKIVFESFEKAVAYISGKDHGGE